MRKIVVKMGVPGEAASLLKNPENAVPFSNRFYSTLGTRVFFSLGELSGEATKASHRVARIKALLALTLLKIFGSNRGCGLSARTSRHYAVNLHKLTSLAKILKSVQTCAAN